MAIDKIKIIGPSDMYGLWFSGKEFIFLRESYDYYMDLLSGKVEPESDEQRIFIKTFNEKIKPYKEPIKYHSKVYQELSLFQKAIIRYYYVQLHKENIRGYHKAQGSDSIYYLSKAQVLFAGKVKLPKHLKNAEHYKEVLKKHNKL